MKPALIQPPALRQHQSAPIQPGQVVQFLGRLVIVQSVHGSDPAAPVIVEEMVPLGHALRGQLGLWPMRAFGDPASGRVR